jgi:hypothetical protein
MTAKRSEMGESAIFSPRFAYSHQPGRITQSSPVVTIVNQAFANRYFAKEDPVGRRIVLGPPPNLAIQVTWLGNQDIQATVIGVVRDTKNHGLASAIEPQVMTLFRRFTAHCHHGKCYPRQTCHAD